MYRFCEWLKLREEISFIDALKLFGYKPGDFVDEDDYKKRLHKLAMQFHPDRAGPESHNSMVDVNRANELLKVYKNQTIPLVAGFTASTPPPKAKPKPKPEPKSAPTANWADVGLHGSDRRTFGKWLHAGIVELLDTVHKYSLSRDANKLSNAVAYLGEVLGEMMRGFDEWQIKSHEKTNLSREDFFNLLEKLDTSGDAKTMRGVLKGFKQILASSFYDKYIKDFPPSL